MNKYDEILEWIAAGTNRLVIAMLSIMYFLIQADGMDADHLGDVMHRIGMKFDTSAKVLVDGETVYTVNDLISVTITKLYPNSVVITPEFISLAIYKMKRYGHITSEQAAALRTALVNA